VSEPELIVLPGDGDDMEAPGPGHPAWRGLAGRDGGGSAPAGPYSAEVGRRMRQVRQARGLTLRGLEKASEGRFTAMTVGSWERGERGIRMPSLAAYAQWLGVSVRIFLPPDPGEQAWRLSVASDTAARALRDLTGTVTAIGPAEAGELLVTALREQAVSA
jgi:transcriptional regulator with XRE-family HTH domain